MPRLSVILIVRDEARQIRECLESVAWAEEIVVVDSGSRDATPEICREYTQQVYSETDWRGFGVQKNRALDRASGEWVLSMDADERVTPALRAEIEQAMAQTGYAAWWIPRRSSYCGRFMSHGDWAKDRVLRLFRRTCARFSEDLVHERVILGEGKTGQLQQPILHYSFGDLEQVLDKLNRYSSDGAKMRLASARRAGLGQAIAHGLWAFLRGYLFRLGFLDGREGFILAVSNAEGVYYRYLKLMYLQQAQQAKIEE